MRLTLDLRHLALAMCAALASASPAAADSADFTLCGSGPRVTCVVDGDTLWLRGTKIRLEGVDAPEKSQPQCAQEAIMAADATRRLMDLLNAGEFEVTRQGNRDEDRYGRKLRTIEVDGQSVGDILIAEGLARFWPHGLKTWCEQS